MIKISVIIPVYNAQGYLGRCLDSVCNQTLSDIEIICVNDASIDNSLEILNNYAKKYSNIKVIDCKTNGGESKARNIGLNNATGEFIAFVDNDDTIDLDFYEKLYNKAKETNADIVKADVREIGYYGEVRNGQLNKKIISTGNKWHFRYEWWCAIYKRKLILDNNISLPEGSILGGDCLFLHYAIEKCKRLEVINNTYYYWRRRVDSGESEVLSLKKILSALKIFDEMLDNTNHLYSSKQIGKDSYQILLESCLWIPINYIYRNNDLESKQICVKYIFKFMNKSLDKQIFREYVLKEYPIIYKYLENNDENGLYQYLLNIPSIKQFDAKNLVARLRNNVKKNEKSISNNTNI